jgi:hypothetical protein
MTASTKLSISGMRRASSLPYFSLRTANENSWKNFGTEWVQRLSNTICACLTTSPLQYWRCPDRVSNAIWPSLYGLQQYPSGTTEGATSNFKVLFPVGIGINWAFSCNFPRSSVFMSIRIWNWTYQKFKKHQRFFSLLCFKLPYYLYQTRCNSCFNTTYSCRGP